MSMTSRRIQRTMLSTTWFTRLLNINCALVGYTIDSTAQRYERQLYSIGHGSNEWQPHGNNSTLAFTSQDSSQRSSIKSRQIQLFSLAKIPYPFGQLTFTIPTTITIISFPEMEKKRKQAGNPYPIIIHHFCIGVGIIFLRLLPWNKKVNRLDLYQGFLWQCLY